METEVAERPIIMQSHNVLAILDGRKTQTRRVIKPQPDIKPFVGHLASEFGGGPWDRPEDHWVIYDWMNTDCGPEGGDIHWSGRCPYGVPGDRLWIREKFASTSRQRVEYAADMMSWGVADAIDWDTGICVPNAKCFPSKIIGTRGIKWRSPLHMPRWASRITLEITEVCVQRVHQISDSDVIAEGIDQIHIDKNRPFFDPRDVHALAFGESWNKINGKRSGCRWQDNPWVWAISFRVLPPHATPSPLATM